MKTFIGAILTVVNYY